MSFVNFAKREITFSVVYYGPPLAGKTTNVEHLHAAMPDKCKGQITMLSTREDRTLYFDFLPLKSQAIRGFTSKFQLYTVPGQPIYDQTRRVVLIGVDGIVFVADSQWDRMRDNAWSLENLNHHLSGFSRRLDDIPWVLQFNKRDLPDIAPTHYMDYLLNRGSARAPTSTSIATEGTGVRDTLNRVCKMVMAKFLDENQMPRHEVEQAGELAIKEA